MHVHIQETLHKSCLEINMIKLRSDFTFMVHLSDPLM